MTRLELQQTRMRMTNATLSSLLMLLVISSRCEASNIPPVDVTAFRNNNLRATNDRVLRRKRSSNQKPSEQHDAELSRIRRVLNNDDANYDGNNNDDDANTNNNAATDDATDDDAHGYYDSKNVHFNYDYFHTDGYSTITINENNQIQVADDYHYWQLWVWVLVIILGMITVWCILKCCGC